MRNILVCAAFVATLPFSAFASAASGYATAANVGNATFEIVPVPGRTGARSYWCAAGEYAFAQGARANARIYLVSGRQPSTSQPGREAVRFTLSPEAAGVTPISPQLSLSVSVPGDNLSVAAAREYCAISVSGR